MDEAIDIVNSRYVYIKQRSREHLFNMDSHSDHPLALYVFTNSSTTYNHSKFQMTF